ncbi:MAG: transposase [Chromatiales bacterium]|nr:transposase [Chromatiales bacterium]
MLSEFFDALSKECAAGIEAVAMDMGAAYICATMTSLPSAAIVFDRFHIMQMFSTVIRDCRRAEFKSAKTLGDLTGEQAIKGSLYLLLGNRDNLKSSDQQRLDKLLEQNEPLNKIYTLKEQLQALWRQPATPADMTIRLLDWCGMAEAAKITGLSKFVKGSSSPSRHMRLGATPRIGTAPGGQQWRALLRRQCPRLRDTCEWRSKSATEAWRTVHQACRLLGGDDGPTPHGGRGGQARHRACAAKGTLYLWRNSAVRRTAAVCFSARFMEMRRRYFFTEYPEAQNPHRQHPGLPLAAFPPVSA